MKLIFISGPSGSGKTTLANQILARIKDGIVLSTDNYYKTGIISKILSKFIRGYFDRNISFNSKLFKKDFHFIIKNGISINNRSYNFKDKTIKNFLTEIKDVKFIIVEGIFANYFSRTLSNKKFFLLELKTTKLDCMTRVVHRDLKERGKVEKQAKNDFLESWNIYYNNPQNKSIKISRNKIIITKNTNIEKIIQKIFNWIF